jgi:hypothetical protein
MRQILKFRFWPPLRVVRQILLVEINILLYASSLD